MLICIVTNSVEAHQVLQQYSQIDAIIQIAENDFITTFLFRADGLYANSLKGVQSNFGWHMKFSPERHFTASVLGSLTSLKTKIRGIIPLQEEVKYLEYRQLARS